MSSYRFIKELIKDARKITKNTDKADELERLAELTDYNKTISKDAIDAQKVLRKNAPDPLDQEYSDYLDNLNNERFTVGHFSKEAHNSQGDLNNLLNEIIRQKQREINPKKLRLNDYINRKDPNFYYRPHRERRIAWDSEDRPYTTWDRHLNFIEPMDRDVMDLFITRRGLLNRYFPERPNISSESAAEHTKWLEDNINKELLAKFLEEGF